MSKHKSASLGVAVAVALLAAVLPGRAATQTMGGASLPALAQPSFTPRPGLGGTALATGQLSVELRVAPACEVALRPNKEGKPAAQLVCAPVSTAWMANATPRDAALRAFVAFEPRGVDNAVQATRSPGWLQRGAVLQLDY